VKCDFYLIHGFDSVVNIIAIARCTHDIKSRTVMVKAAFSKKKTLHQQIGLKFREQTSEMLHVK
jgi:hypothetical protein